MSTIFLTTENVLHIHEIQLAMFGGGTGIRKLHLLESAVAQPKSGFGDKDFHRDVFDKAGAYWFCITKNHPFVDGNKRTGLCAALVFLYLNGYEVLLEEEEILYSRAMKVASTAISSSNAASKLRLICKTL